MSLFFDVTKSNSARQLSGLTRVSEKLRLALTKKLGEALVPVVWHSRKRCFVKTTDRGILNFAATDSFLTPEVFSSDERPGFYEYLADSRVRLAAIFHDAIPLQYPDIIWPHSVARHSLYMRDLVRFQHVFSVSAASQTDLVNHWKELKFPSQPSVSTIYLGADFFDRSSKSWTHRPQEIPLILNIGILEPRKNQSQLLDLARSLWDEGFVFELHFVGRINPHFGKPIEKKIKQAKKAGCPVYLHSKQSDDALLNLYSKARFTVFNSFAEGFGLPVVESLWLGVPCISTNLPSLKDMDFGAACIRVDSGSELKQSIATWLTDATKLTDANNACGSLNLPTWSDAGVTLIDWMRSS